MPDQVSPPGGRRHSKPNPQDAHNKLVDLVRRGVLTSVDRHKSDDRWVVTYDSRFGIGHVTTLNSVGEVNAFCQGLWLGENAAGRRAS